MPRTGPFNADKFQTMGYKLIPKPKSILEQAKLRLTHFLFSRKITEEVLDLSFNSFHPKDAGLGQHSPKRKFWPEPIMLLKTHKQKSLLCFVQKGPEKKRQNSFFLYLPTANRSNGEGLSSKLWILGERITFFFNYVALTMYGTP